MTEKPEPKKPKCPECGSTNIKDKITCLDCGYEYFVWDIA